ncbi:MULTISPECIES: NAD(P)/FAD-dependent oxidoreductase [Acidianus]|uniref:Pyridine nucleotide-disulfide oxidoreductase n=1 Tax=Candidatus Acidianus copahuensis TaxID=1160895 RepID=A0A031LK99_9CREN|nr:MULTISPECIES: FAD-dependent oxidoreductase [Acidianus]EZQ01895.1 pyridine nucleotide-disulfide oxidoreductase [Candidatus Acidianus copahuensis]NON61947.1 FAD-dependent oxidoreductase [Acidianus sp. RZ1]
MRIIALGGGFAGLAARKLGATVIDEKDYFVLPHRLVDVIRTGDPDIARISYPSDIIKTRVRKVDFRGKKVITDIGEIQYDKLIVSLGYSQNVIPGTLKIETVEEALSLREKINSSKKVAILGGGPLGVELAWVSKEMGKEVYLIEGKDRLLSFMSKEASFYAKSKLEELGVKVMTNTKVSEISGKIIHTTNGKIEADVSISSLGFKGPSIISEMGLTHVNDRMLVDDYLQSVDYDDVYGAGDCATTKGFIPMSAQVAVQAGTRAALNALGKDEKFSYRQFAVIVRIGDEYFGDFLGRFVKGSFAKLAEKIGIYRATRLVI